MSDLVTISSGVYVNDDATTTERFAAFTLDGADAQALTQINNRVSAGRPAGLSFEGYNLLSVAGVLEAVECRGLVGPRGNMAGFREALCFEGELLNVAYTLADNAELTETGIITDLAVRVGPQGKLAQRIDFVFHRVDRLRYLNSSTYLSKEQDA